MTSTSPRQHLSLIGKRLLTISLFVLFTCVILTVVLQPAGTSAQEPGATPLPTTTLPGDVAAQSKASVTATPASVWSATPTPAGYSRPAKDNPGAVAAGMSSMSLLASDRGYLDLGASFYSDIFLSQLVVAKRYERLIDFEQWCEGQEALNFVACKLTSEQPSGQNYSVRWQAGLLVPRTGTYTFTVARVDDQARIFLDGSSTPVAELGWDSSCAWGNGASASGQIMLTQGLHDVKVEYRQCPPGRAMLQIRWAGPTFADEVIPFAQHQDHDDQYHDKGCPVCGNEESQDFAGDPINTFTGNFNYLTTDLSIATAGQPLRFERSYNSLTVTGTAIYSQPLGYGWTHNYDVRLTFPNDPGGEPGTVIFKIPHGSRARFADLGNGIYEPWPGVRATLARSLSSPYLYTVTVVNQAAFVFTNTGRLINQIDSKGNQTTLAYQADLTLTRVTAPGTARWLDFGYDSLGRLTSITDHTGRHSGYGYDVVGNLIVVTDTRGLTWTYTYTGSHLLHTLIQPDGNIVERLFYDERGLALRQEDGLGNSMIRIDYLGGGQRLLNERGRIVTDTYDVENRLWTGQVFAAGRTAYTFDDSDNRTSSTDGNGHTTKYDRTPFGLTTAITDALDNTTHLVYDARNNLTTYADPAGNTTYYEYDSNNNLIASTDTLSHTTRYAYDHWGHVISTTTPAGQTTQYEYDEFGQQTVVTDPAGLVTRNGYDALGRVITTTASTGLATVNTYDNADHLVAVTRNYTSTSAEQNFLDAYNLITHYQYDGFGRQIAVTDTVGHVTRNFYDGAGRLVSTTVNYSPTVGPNYQSLYNFTTFYGYDTAGRQIWVTDTLGTATRTEYDNLSRPITVTQNYKNGIFDPLIPDEDLASVTRYDAVGNPIEQIDPAGRITRTYYDSLNRVISTTANYTTTTSQPGYLNLYNLTTWHEYDEVGRQVAITDTQGRVTRHYYDVLGRAISTTQNYRADVGANYLGQYNLITLNEYNTLGQRVAVSDALAHPTHYTYDAMGRMIQTQDALGGTSETAYDRLGRRSVVTDALQHTTIYTYDAAGRLSRMQDAGGNVTAYGYDVLGRTIVVTDPLGHATRTFYDFAGRVVSATNALSGTTTTLYDALGRALRTQDARGYWTDYQYDRLGRTVVLTDATGAMLRTQYDRAGNRIKSTDGLSHTTVYTYDAAGHLIAQADSVGNTTRYTYDVAGNRIQTIDANGVATGYGYDSLDRLVVVTESLTGTLGLDPARYNVVTRYGYDALGNRTVMTNARGYTTTYEYDALSRLSKTQDARGKVTAYSYDALGNRSVMTDANGEVTLYAYDALNRPGFITYTTDGQTVQYAYDAVGNRTAMTDSLGTTHYQYDELQRLTVVTDPFTGTVQYTYDANGNRTQLIYPDGKVVTYTYDAGNRLSSVIDWAGQTTTYQYDQAGRLSAVRMPNGIETAYTYDAANRLIRLTHTRNSIEMIGDYQFVLDGVGNRLTVTETLLPPGTGGQLGALPPTFAAEVLAAVTGWRAPGLSAPRVSTTTPANASQFDEHSLVAAALSNSTNSMETLATDRPTTDPIELAEDQAAVSRFGSDGQWGEITRRAAAAPSSLDARQEHPASGLLAPLAQGGSGLDRREENHASITYAPSAWTRASNNRMSRGYYNGTNTAGRTASLTFTGSWVGLGFLTTADGGQARVYLDGVSQGVIDTYSRDENVTSVYYRNLVSGTHTISLTVLSTRHANSTGTWVRLDYIDLWAGAPATGRFEENDSRVITSTNWTRDGGYAGASGGYYYRDGSNVWFGFEGDTVTYQAVARTNDGEVAVLVDGQTRAYLTLKNSATITRVLSLDNLGAGPHVLQISAYRDSATVDAFITPGSAPYYQPPVRSGVIRYEEDDPIVRYGAGWPYPQRPSGWTATKDANTASDGYYVSASAAGQTVTLVFTGTWAGLGYVATSDSGQISVTLDGIDRGVVDAYARLSAPQSVYYNNLASGTHTLTLRVLSTRHPHSTGTNFRFDYFDVWDGTNVPTGTFETAFATTWNWTRDTTYAGASNGDFYRNGTAMWQAFTGNAITYQAIARNADGEVEVSIDGQVQGYLNLKNSTTITRPFSFGNLSSGPHVLQVRAYRDAATVDAFITPGSAPYYQPPARTGVIRYEEDDPIIRYGVNAAYLQRPAGWSETKDASLASDGYYVSASAAGQTVTLVFTGTWLGLGYVATTDSGQISVTLDGVSRGIVDAYARFNMPQSVYYNDLASGTHTLTLKVLGTKHPHSSNTNFKLDYFDVWDGTDIPTGTFETPPAYAGAGSFATTWGWTDNASGVASGGRYYSAGGSNALWQAFTGSSITYQGLASTTDGEVEVRVDGQVQGYINLKNSATITRAVSFGNLSAGPHVLQVRAYRDTATVDAFSTPGSAPYYQPPVRSGITRYEEDDPIIRYGLNASYLQMPQVWNANKDASLASDGYYVSAATAGQTVTLVFTGTWLGLGYVATTDSGQISVTLDGIDRGVVDAYARFNMPQSVYYANLASGTHTLTLRLLSTRHPHSTGNNFRFDYFDVWDGTAVATGTFETPPAYAGAGSFATTWNWTDTASGAASGGRYYNAGTGMWQAFTGDSITYQSLASTSGGEVEVRIDGQVQGYVNLKNSATITRTFSFGNLNSGPHVLQVRAYRGTATVDAFLTPGNAPYYQPPTRSGIARYEEDDPIIRYGLNAAYLQMPQVWNAINDNNLASDGYYLQTNSAGQTVTLPFTGTWIGFGYIATANSGQVTITLDGVQLGVLDAYAPTTMQRSWYTRSLASGVHTLTLKLSSLRNANSSGTYFNFDYFDQWDGSLLPAGRFETPFATTWNWTEIASGIASGGRYYSAGSSNAMWHAFTSDAVTYQALTSNSTVTVEVSIDGITRGLVSLYHPTVITRTFDYGGLGVGPHVLQVRAVNGTATVDAFITAAFFPTATQRTVITYAYDPLYRLTKADSTGALTTTFEYAYDPVGNRTTQTATITSTVVTAYQYDAANRLINRTESTGQAYTYAWSDRGEMLAEYFQGNPIRTFTYNAAGQLSEATVLTLTTRFRYNGDGQRLSLEVVGQDTTTYALDYLKSGRILMETTAQTTTLYLYGHSCLGEWNSTEGWKYYLQSTLGQVRQAVDSAGDVIYSWAFNPDGTVLQGVQGPITHLECDAVYDWSTGLIYRLGRYFDPTTGAWLVGTGMVLAQAGSKGKRKSKRRLLLLLLLLLCVVGVLTACDPPKPPDDCTNWPPEAPKIRDFDARITGEVDVSGAWGTNELHFGKPGSPGVTFEAVLEVPSKAEGVLTFAQIGNVKRVWTKEDGQQWKMASPGWMVDTNPYYGESWGIDSGGVHYSISGEKPRENTWWKDGNGLLHVITEDSPGQPTNVVRNANQLEVYDQYEMYLLWKPSTGEQTPLGVISWEWSAKITRSSTDWSDPIEPHAKADEFWRCATSIRPTYGNLIDLWPTQ